MLKSIVKESWLTKEFKLSGDWMYDQKKVKPGSWFRLVDEKMRCWAMY